MTLFHEIYGVYYNTVAKILAEAVAGTLTENEIRKIIEQNAFSESVLTILPSLKSGAWQLLDENLHTPLRHAPALPLTFLQKRWLKSISLDPRIRLFDITFEQIAQLDGITPLFTPQDYVVFDSYCDGDCYADKTYQDNFKTVLAALKTKRKLQIEFYTRKGERRCTACYPRKLEYSLKDDKFRLITSGRCYDGTINIARIISCSFTTETSESDSEKVSRCFHPVKAYLVMEVIDERNALERALLHFANFEKRAERLGENRYRLNVFYDAEDETELVIRVLSFGPFLKVTEPYAFVEKIRERLRKQKSCGI